MKNLRSEWALSILCLFISACQSSKVFDIKTVASDQAVNRDDLHIISIDSNRVQQKCLFFNAEAENNWRHQYLMFILDDKNEVLEIMHPTNQDKESCQSQLGAIEKLLQQEEKVKLCIRDPLKRRAPEGKDQSELIQFGPLGEHRVVYEALTLDSVCNSKNCHSHNDIWVQTCPGFPKQ